MRGNQSILHTAFAALVQRSARIGSMLGIDPEGVSLFEAPTDDLVGELKHGNREKIRALFARRRGIVDPKKGSGKNRLEENYLYSTRRFPAAVNNTIGAGAIPTNRYQFFASPLGQDAAVMGFPTGNTLAETETNMEGSAGTIAKGQNFVFNQIGISLNSDVNTNDCAQVMDAGALVFSKSGGQFSLIHGPVRLWPGGTGVTGYAITTVAATTITAAHNGSADIRAVRHLKIPRVIKETETFKYEYVVARATKGTDGTAFALSQFVLMTLWLWGGAQIAIPL
jgi:hypothetical protein